MEVYKWLGSQDAEKDSDAGAEKSIRLFITAGDNMVVVPYTETYDLSTKQNRMSILGIHTPGTATMAYAYGGFFQNYKYFRVVSCDVVLACASSLPLDPLGIGVDSDQVNPQDMFNPILYRANTTDGFNAIVGHTYNGSMATGSVNVASQWNDTVAPNDDFILYYGILASQGWKKAMPQQGLTMKGLYPMVYQVVNSFGNYYTASSGTPALNTIQYVNAGGALTSGNMAATFRGPTMRMPKMPTVAVSASTGNWTAANLPTCYVGTIIMPPCAGRIMYYRLRVTWHIEFSGPCTIPERGNMTDYRLLGAMTYNTDYAEGSKMMESINGTVDGVNADIRLVMSDGGVSDAVQTDDGAAGTPQVFE